MTGSALTAALVSICRGRVSICARHSALFATRFLKPPSTGRNRSSTACSAARCRAGASRAGVQPQNAVTADSSASAIRRLRTRPAVNVASAGTHSQQIPPVLYTDRAIRSATSSSPRRRPRQEEVSWRRSEFSGSGHYRGSERARAPARVPGSRDASVPP